VRRAARALVLAAVLLAGCESSGLDRDLVTVSAVAPSTTSTTPPTLPLPSSPTSTTAPSTTTTTAAPAPSSELRSTAYCLAGSMASGRPTYVGAVAANRYRIGTVLEAWPNPWGDRSMRFTVEDRHRDGATELDFAMPSKCDRALRWGNRRFVSVRVVG
jgi:hypothetical protein